MSKVVLLSTESNPSTIEKNHNIAEGVQHSGLPTSVIYICHDAEYESIYASLAKISNYKWDLGPKGPLFKGSTKIAKLWSNIRLTLGILFKSLRILLREKQVTFIIPRESIQIACVVWFCRLFFPCRIVANIMEYSPALPDYGKHRINSLTWWMVRYISDGFIVISKYLEEKLGSTKPVFFLPAIISSQDLDNAFNSGICRANAIDEVPLFIYSASSGYSDILDFCLSSIALIRQRDFRLVITGKFTEQDKSSWQSRISDLGIEHKVDFSGFLDQSSFDSLQRHSTALLLPLTNAENHKARFPQKILGYMSMGKLLVTTAVGEMGKAFEDGVNAFIDSSVTPAGFAAKILQVLDEPDKAQKVSAYGAKYVKDKFDYRKWGRLLVGFIGGLHNGKAACHDNNSNL